MSYLRQPSISGDTIAFIADDDVWTVDAAGGRARRLTAGHTEASYPRLSPDGGLIGFTSNDEAMPEVWCIPTAGGDARRLSHFGVLVTQTVGWTPDNRIVAISASGQPFARWTMGYTVDPATGRTEQLPLGPLRSLSYEPGGDGVVLTRYSSDPARWKRYRGGTAGQIWVDRRGAGASGFRRILADNPADLAFAMWVGGRIYFLSDHEGIGNVYSVRPGGQDLRRHTDHDEFYARTASTDGTRIVYAHAADLWLFDPAEGESRQIVVETVGGSAQRRRRYVPAIDRLTGFQLHPQGQSALLETRGQIVEFPLWEQAPRSVTPAAGVRQRLASYLPDGVTVACVSDASGEERIVVHPPEGDPRTLETGDLGDIWELAVAPAGAPRAAVVNQRHELHLVDLESGDTRLLDSSAQGDLGDVSWSPDGRWIAYRAARSRTTRSISISDAGSGRMIEVTRPEFNDHSPVFDATGRYLYFISERYLDPVLDEVFLDLNFPRTAKVFVVPLRAGERSPWLASPRPMRDAADAKLDRSSEPPSVTVDADGIDTRAVSSPLPGGRYLKLLPLPDALLVLSAEIEGTLEEDIFLETPASHTLLRVDIPSGRTEPLITDIADVTLSTDGSSVLYRSKDRLRALPAGAKPPSRDEKGDEPSRASGWLDLDRVRVAVEPAAEWRQMYAETWRLQRELFWDADFSGVDWPRVRERYQPLVGRVGTRADLSDLLWELQGELGTSHAYEMGGDRRKPQPWGLGFLGADLTLDRRGRWQVARLVRCDSWDPKVGSPLAAPGVDVVEGDLIVEVDRRPVDADRPLAAELVNTAGRKIELTVTDSRGRRRRQVVVQPLRDETALRYRSWVEDRRRHVREATDGAAGYVHVPDMGTVGYAEFHRSYLMEVERDGLIIDVRNNRGGFVSQLLLEKLARPRVGFDVTRFGPASPFPEASPAGPMVCVTNQWAGSDGDIFSHCFKLMGLGQLVGTRTWGGVIGINGKHRLIDGTMTTQPELSFWFRDVGWGVENYGTDPDVVVDMTPADWTSGADPQLDRAIGLLTRQLRRHRPDAPDTSRTQLTLPTLPPRG